MRRCPACAETEALVEVLMTELHALSAEAAEVMGTSSGEMAHTDDRNSRKSKHGKDGE